MEATLCSLFWLAVKKKFNCFKNTLNPIGRSLLLFMGGGVLAKLFSYVKLLGKMLYFLFLEWKMHPWRLSWKISNLLCRKKMESALKRQRGSRLLTY